MLCERPPREGVDILDGPSLSLIASGSVSRRLFPSLHHRKEGCLRHQENFAKPPKWTQTGWFSFRARSENHPVLAIFGCFAIFFLLARPPLLAVVQGGE